MFITIHAAAATIIGKEIGQPALAFALGVISHFILDMIPHGDEDLGKKFFGIKIREKHDLRLMALYGSLDACCLAIFLLFLFKNFPFAYSDSVSWAIIGGVIPDILVGIYKLTNIKLLKGFTEFHARNHRRLIDYLKFDFPMRYGVVMQIGVLIALLAFVFWY